MICKSVRGALTLIVALCVNSADAQATTAIGGPLLLVLTPQFPYRDAEAVMIRRATITPHDVVILRRERVTATYIKAVLQQAMEQRARDGTSVIRNRVTVLHPKAGDIAVDTLREHRVAALLPKATPRPVRGLGDVAVLEVTLPLLVAP